MFSKIQKVKNPTQKRPPPKNQAPKKSKRLNQWSGDQSKENRLPVSWYIDSTNVFKNPKRQKPNSKKAPKKLGPQKIQKVKPVVKSKKS
jgi:hypothetical protein